MSEFYQLTPRKQGERIRRLAVEALRLWNIEGADLELLKFRENAVFSVATKSAERYALRIHRYGYHTDAELRSELQWIQALDAEGIDVPSIVPSASTTTSEQPRGPVASRCIPCTSPGSCARWAMP